MASPSPAPLPNPVAHAAALAWKPSDMRPPWQWAEENYYVPVSSMPGRWRSDNSPWVKQVMADFANNAVRQITVLCSAQSAKTETLGQPWEDRLRFAKSEGYIEACIADFDPRAPWPAEARRFLCIDVQGKGGRHFYYSVHAFAQGGQHRVLNFGKAWSVEELRSVMTDWHVPAQNVAIDSGHWASEVYGYVLESGVLPSGDYAWKCLKGDRAQHYVIEGIRQPFTWSFVDPYMGTQKQNQVRPIRQILFSKPTLLDRAEAQMRGLGPKLEIPKHEAQLHEYQMQLTAYERLLISQLGLGMVKITIN